MNVLTGRIAISFLLLAAVQVQAQEKKIKRSQLPAAVELGVKAEESKGAKAVGFATEMENGKKLYEAEMKVNGHGKDVSFDEAGKVVAVEEETPITSIPPAAKAAIQKAAGAGKVTMVESVNEAGKAFYEAQIKGGKVKSIQVAADGSIVK